MKSFNEWMQETIVKNQPNNIKWVMPNIQKEMDELERTADTLGVDLNGLVQAAKQSKLVPLDEMTWRSMKNTEDMIGYLKQHHDKNLHPDYLDHLTSTNSKFVLKNIPINSIKTELSGLDRAKVERYKKMDFSKAPPIVVGSDGYILDGYHRATAAKALGIPTIKAYVGVKGQQGVTEGRVINTHLWHGSRNKHPVLAPTSRRHRWCAW